MSEYTLGPWQYKTGETSSIRDADGGKICGLHWLKGQHGLSGRRSHKEVAANGRLIAAAPDLLAALQLTVELINNITHWSPDIFKNGVTDSTGSIDEGEVIRGHIMDAARAAIAKATNGTETKQTISAAPRGGE